MYIFHPHKITEESICGISNIMLITYMIINSVIVKKKYNYFISLFLKMFSIVLNKFKQQTLKCLFNLDVYCFIPSLLLLIFIFIIVLFI